MLEMALRSWRIQPRGSHQPHFSTQTLACQEISPFSALCAGRARWGYRGCISQDKMALKKQQFSKSRPTTGCQNQELKEEVSLSRALVWRNQDSAWPSRPAGITSLRAKIYKLSMLSSPPHQNDRAENSLENFFFLLFLAKDKTRHFNCSNKNPFERPGVKG